MKYIVSRYNHNIDWLAEYTDDVVMYDRSDNPVYSSIVVPNIGTDIYDKFTYIIENYDNLPEVAVYTKANLFKYISQGEFNLVKDNRTFTPLLTRHHKVYLPVCYYSEDGMYNEINDYWYIPIHHPKSIIAFESLKDLLGMRSRVYNKFAPGSNYIVPRENIRKHPIDYYKRLRDYLTWTTYPGEAQMIERSLYELWS